MSAHRSTPVNRNELGELPLLTLDHANKTAGSKARRTQLSFSVRIFVVITSPPPAVWGSHLGKVGLNGSGVFLMCKHCVSDMKWAVAPGTEYGAPLWPFFFSSNGLGVAAEVA